MFAIYSQAAIGDGRVGRLNMTMAGKTTHHTAVLEINNYCMF